MKKRIVTITLVCCALLAAAPLPAQNGAGADVALNLKTYNSYFFSDGKIKTGSKYIDPVSDEDYDKFSVLNNEIDLVDTPLEFALLSYYSQPVVNIRPVEAAKLLPANSRESEVKLAAATYSELQEIRFLDAQNSGRIVRYEGMLKFITDKQKITQAEITASLRASIHAVVDAEFNRVDFFISNILDSSANSYNGILTRNPKTGQYNLSYEDAKDVTKELTAPTLEALTLKMRDSGDFVPKAIDTVRAQAALIPAVNRPVELARTKQALVNFYLTPSQQTYQALKDLYIKYVSVASLDQPNGAVFLSFKGGNISLSPELYSRLNH